MNRPILPPLCLLILVVALPASAQRVHKEFPLTNEKELTVIVDVSFGTLILDRGPKGKVAVVDFEQLDDERDGLHVTYEPGERAKLRIKSKKTSRIFPDSDRDSDERRVVLKCTENIPITFELELGAGRGELDLTGMQVQDLRISTGASDVKLWCSQPNTISADYVEIESGVSKFTAEDLSNLNFRKLKFSGGVGSYRLGFGGRLMQNGEVNIDVGLGAVIVNVPEEISARIQYDDNWFAKFSFEGDFHQPKSGVYETVGYSEAQHRLKFVIDAGLGTVRIRRR